MVEELDLKLTESETKTTSAVTEEEEDKSMAKISNKATAPTNWAVLPDVILDILLGRILPVEDIRSFHQVCKNWARAVEGRSQVNERRRAFVNRVHQDKENLEQDVLQILDLRTNSSKSTDGKGSDSKPGSRPGIVRGILRSSASSNASSNRSSQATPKSSSNRSSPKSRYQIQFDAARKLKEGEVLSPCPECRSPVPSPSPVRQSIISRVCVNRNDLKETPTESCESMVIHHNRNLQYWQCQCPTCSYRFCARCKFKDHPGKPCREIDGETNLINESDRLRNSKTFSLRNSKPPNRRKKNPTLRRIANL